MLARNHDLSACLTQPVKTHARRGSGDQYDPPASPFIENVGAYRRACKTVSNDPDRVFIMASASYFSLSTRRKSCSPEIGICFRVYAEIFPSALIAAFINT
jgi:hypothetical protein